MSSLNTTTLTLLKISLKFLVIYSSAQKMKSLMVDGVHALF